MNKRSRFHLVFGLLLVAAVCAGLVLYTSHANSRLTSTTAILRASSVAVGADYAGTVTEQFVRVGDTVKTGDKLFQLKSATLVQALASNQLQKSDLQFSLTPDNQLIVTANNNGYVSAIAYPQGSYVPNGSQIATITTNDNLTVNAEFKMTPTQYAKTTSTTPLDITLPGSLHTSAKITSITIKTDSNPLIVTIAATVNTNDYDAIKAGQGGTPVGATLVLGNDALWNRARDAVHRLRSQ